MSQLVTMYFSNKYYVTMENWGQTGTTHNMVNLYNESYDKFQT